MHMRISCSDCPAGNSTKAVVMTFSAFCNSFGRTCYLVYVVIILINIASVDLFVVCIRYVAAFCVVAAIGVAISLIHEKLFSCRFTLK